ncbi:MAG: Lytic transglycosylase catalytic [Gemmatimonadetes bacterium]|nr:Lytic transglycosylase catalytic [Gemmatimonadota bacterium]
MTLLRSIAVALSLCACRDSQQLSAGEVAPSSELAVATAPSAPLTDPDAKAAAAEIAAGHPWLATRRLAPLLRGAKANSAELRLVAARAAAAWDGWSEVERLLASQSWLGSRFGGEGLELLARSALSRSADTLAVGRALAAVKAAPASRARAMRLVLLARALDRREVRDSARATYERAAAQLPEVRDWLLLRAAGVQMDSAARSRLYAGVRLPAARTRIANTEAQALERFGNAAAAARKYAALGATVSSIRLRAMAIRGDSGHVSLLRRELLSWMEAHPQGVATDVRAAVDVLDKYFTPLSPQDELVLARAALGAGLAARAVTGFGRAPSLAQSDRLAYGQALAKVGKHREAIAQFDSITDASALGARAAYQRARSQLALGDAAGTRATLHAATERWSTLAESDAALFLLADLTTDDGDEAGARTLFRTLAQKFPGSPRAPEASFRAALLGYVAQPSRAVAAEFDSVAERFPKSDEHLSASYWSGRALAASGDSAAARTHWERIIAQEPASYYALMSSARLGRPWAAPTDSGTSIAPVQLASQHAFVRRVALLDSLGMDAEQRVEFDALEEASGASAASLLPAAAALAEAGQASRASRLAIRAIEAGDRSRSAYMLAYPLVHGEALVTLATKRSLDPWLVAALIRQESSFNPRAVSAAGARGLMQVMPDVGRQLGSALGFPVWDNALLLEPDANLEMGTEHLANFLRQFDDLPRALAAYNAGQARVQRWAKKSGSADAELFAESIPFEETRDYVRNVQRNRAMYAVLYERK